MQNERPTRARRSNSGAPPRPTTRLKAERVQEALRRMPGWKLARGAAAISRTFRFRSSTTPLLFAALVGGLAEEEGHHPALTIRSDKVVCRLSSSTACGVTLKDLVLARRISLLE